jgi:uncharacterized protein (TIGR00297 family)
MHIAAAYRAVRLYRMHAVTPSLALWMFLGRPARLLTAAGVAVGFACLARALRGVTLGGAIAGAGLCFLLYAGAGRGAFFTLVCLFALAWSSTRWRYQRKQKLGTAEKRDGRRATQVLANLSVAAACALGYGLSDRNVFLLAMVAAIAEAAADTVSSEIGQASATSARLVTTWEAVPAGTDGGITLRGTLVGAGAATLVSVVGGLTHLVDWQWVWVCIVAAVAGMMADSFMGAWLERRKLLTNDLVNFLSTLFASLIGIILS